MSASDVDQLLDVMWDMDIDVNMYLSGKLAPSAVGHRILEGCRRIRQKAADDTAEHQLKDLESAAQTFSSAPETESSPKRQRALGPDDSQLMKGLFDLRAHLLKARSTTE